MRLKDRQKSEERHHHFAALLKRGEKRQNGRMNLIFRNARHVTNSEGTVPLLRGDSPL